MLTVWFFVRILLAVFSHSAGPRESMCTTRLGRPKSKKKLFKYPYLSSEKIWISAVSYSTDTHTNPNISTNSKPNLKIYYGVNQKPIWGRFMKKNQRSTISCYCTFNGLLLHKCCWTLHEPVCTFMYRYLYLPPDWLSSPAANCSWIWKISSKKSQIIWSRSFDCDNFFTLNTVSEKQLGIRR